MCCHLVEKTHTCLWDSCVRLAPTLRLSQGYYNYRTKVPFRDTCENRNVNTSRFYLNYSGGISQISELFSQKYGI